MTYNINGITVSIDSFHVSIQNGQNWINIPVEDLPIFIEVLVRGIKK